MAQTKRKRRRKHRGTPAGTIERPGRTGRPQTRKEAKEIARERRLERQQQPPTWRAAVTRAAIAAVVFGVLMATLLGRPVASAAVLTPLVFLFYVPLGYAVDVFLYRRRQRRRSGAK